MANSTVGDWKGSLSTPTETDGMQLLRYQVVLAVIADERSELLAAYRLEENPMEEDEYQSKTMVLDDLEKQFYELFHQNVPAVEWEEV